jgi:thymidylate synthase
MGRKTWFSIPRESRPLRNRINLILTNDPELLKVSPFSKLKSIDKDIYFLTYQQFLQFYNLTNANVFVIGGGEIYKMFLNSNYLKPKNVYLTEVKCKFQEHNEPDTFIDHLDDTYKLVSFSEKYTCEDLSYRFLRYTSKDVRGHTDEQHKDISQEQNYLNLAKEIIQTGNERIDRTDVGTISKMGVSLRFDISDGKIPLLTTKRVYLKGIIEELLFFCRGDTDTSILENNGVKIWTGNTSRDFLDKRGLEHYRQGVMGPMYGWMWRHYGAQYSQAFSDTSKIDKTKIGGFDQLAHIETLLKKDPFSRRIYMSNLNPKDSHKMVLEPCHTYLQLYVTEENGQKYLSGYFTMRSNDIGCGLPFNLVSYAILVHVLALRADMKPKEIVYNACDAHIYKNHIAQINEQTTRTPRPVPHLTIDDSVKHKEWGNMSFSDFDVIGYYPHPAIKMEMAV